MTNKLSKEAFVKLAKAYSRQDKYENRLVKSLESITEKSGLYMDCIGLPISSRLIMDVVLDLLGSDFDYYFYDCEQDFDKFNKGTILADGTHPNVKNFGELWELG